MKTAPIQQQTGDGLENIVQRLVDHERRHPGSTAKAMTAMGEFQFNTAASSQQDVKAWSAGRKVQEDQSEKSADAARDKEMTFEEREAGLKQILGII